MPAHRLSNFPPADSLIQLLSVASVNAPKLQGVAVGVDMEKRVTKYFSSTRHDVNRCRENLGKLLNYRLTVLFFAPLKLFWRIYVHAVKCSQRGRMPLLLTYNFATAPATFRNNLWIIPACRVCFYAFFSPRPKPLLSEVHTLTDPLRIPRNG